jgi:hypothetical protein
MKNKYLKNLCIALMVFGICMVPSLLMGQYFDYHREESPAISWNGIPLFDARMMGAGGISLFSSPAFSAIVNPALMLSNSGANLGGHKFNIGATFAGMEHEAFQYRGLNEGVFYSSINQTQDNQRLSALAFTLPIRGVYVSAGYYMTAVPELPDFDIVEDGYNYTATFPGKENRFFVAAAFKLSGSIDLGFKLEYVSGSREVATDEDIQSLGVRMQLEEFHEFSYFAPTLGLNITLSPVWKVGIVWDQPLRGSAKGTLNHYFQSSYAQHEILGTETDDSFYRPTNIRVSAEFTPFGVPAAQEGLRFYLSAGLEAVYSMWSQYKYEFGGEEIPRDMNNTTGFALGTEFGFAGVDSAYLLRLGFRLDPQPVSNPDITLNAFTVGLGIRWDRIRLDIAAMFYNGAIDDFSQSHWVVNAGVGLGLN